MHTTNSLLQAFCNYLIDQRHFSPMTANNYATDIIQFHEKTGQLEPTQVTPQVIQEFLDEGLVGYKPRSKARKLATLRSYFNWLLKMKIIVASPAACIPSLKIDRATQSILSPQQITQFFQAMTGERAIDIRDRCIFALSLCYGLKISDILRLNIEHVNLKNATLSIKTRHVVRQIRIDTVADRIQQYLVARVNEDKDPLELTSPLFLNVWGDRLSARSVRRKMDKYMTKAGIDCTLFSPMTLRHTYAKSCIKAGMSIRTLQQALGHRHHTTTRYLYEHDDTTPATASS